MSNQGQSKSPATMATFVKKAEPKMLAAGMNKKVVVKELGFALQAFRKNPYLAQCDPQSLIDSIENIAFCGLTLNPVAKEAYLVPMKKKITLYPSFIGLIKLIISEGCVTSILANPVYENDKFELDLADNIRPIIHRPILTGDAGDIIGFYMVATFPDGTRQVEWMDMVQIFEVRSRSESYKAFLAKKTSTCIWETDFIEMGRKTVIKRGIKRLPRGKSNYVDNAIALDNVDFLASDDQMLLVESLQRSANIPEKVHNRIDEALREPLSKTDASKMIEYLQENQIESTPQMGAAMNITQASAAANAAAARPNT